MFGVFRVSFFVGVVFRKRIFCWTFLCFVFFIGGGRGVCGVGRVVVGGVFKNVLGRVGGRRVFERDSRVLIRFFYDSILGRVIK